MKYLCWDHDCMSADDAEPFFTNSASDAACAFVDSADAGEAEDGDETYVMAVDPDGVQTRFSVTAKAKIHYEAEELK